ncbi:MAG: DUF1559 domain-containing protein, partial [Planctomycetaceae bacterium]|nr:DUF1559 domain-containing protein [Planctomycetaceae bacterium]
MTDSTDKPRGLWKLMNRQSAGEPSDTGQPADDAAHQLESEVPAESPSSDKSDTEDSEPPPRGLWSVMGQSASDQQQAVDAPDGEASASHASAETRPESSSDSAETASPKGLWGVMSGGAPAVPQSVSADPPVPQPDESEDAATEELTERSLSQHLDTESAHSLDSPTSVPPPAESFVTVDSAPAFAQVTVKTGRSKMALAASLVGLFAVPLAALALLPDAWLRLPATIAGFAALMLGLLGWQDVRGSRGRRSGSELATAGMVLGVLAMFLGPIVFARVGQGYRKSFGQQQTITNLETIGSALGSYHREQQHYPAGGIFRTNKDDTKQPMHGWMASLLPHLGEQELHGSIRFNVPYDDPANLPAMRSNVNAFLAAGGDRSPIGRQEFAPAHFAGLGGELNIDGIGLVKVGVFGR